MRSILRALKWFGLDLLAYTGVWIFVFLGVGGVWIKWTDPRTSWAVRLAVLALPIFFLAYRFLAPWLLRNIEQSVKAHES